MTMMLDDINIVNVVDKVLGENLDMLRTFRIPKRRQFAHSFLVAWYRKLNILLL